MRFTATTRRMLLQRQPRGGPCALLPARPPHHAARAHARVAPQAPAVDAGAVAQLGAGTSGPATRDVVQVATGEPPASRAGLPRLPGAAQPRQAATARPAWKRPAAGRSPSARPPARASSRSSTRNSITHPELFPAADQPPAATPPTHGNVRGAEYFRSTSPGDR